MEYNQEAEYLERRLRNTYPKLIWNVMRKEQITDSPTDFFAHYSNTFEIHCQIPGLTMLAVEHIEREILNSPEARWDWILGSLGAGMVHHFGKELLSN